LAQDDQTNAAAQCAIAPTNFWPLPKSDADAIPVNVEFYLFDIVNINDMASNITSSRTSDLV
jgi:hypothetical protein